MITHKRQADRICKEYSNLSYYGRTFVVPNLIGRLEVIADLGKPADRRSAKYALKQIEIAIEAAKKAYPPTPTE